MWSHICWTHWRLVTCGGHRDIGCCAAISGFVDSVFSWTLCFLLRMVRIREMLYSHWISAIIKKVQEDQQGLYLNEMHQFLVCAADIWWAKCELKNTKGLFLTSKEVGLEVNPKKSKYTTDGALGV